MKTMKLENELPVRVKEVDVKSFEKKGYKYCPRSEWKSLVRDINKVEKQEKVEKIKPETSEKEVKNKKTKKSKIKN